MADGRHFKNRNIAIFATVLTDFDEIWHDDAYWPLTAKRSLKFQIFENSRWRQPPC